jgi:hypothetical protein
VLHSPSRNLGSRADTELVPDPLNVAFGGSLCDEQTLRDFTVCQPGGDQNRNFALPPAEWSGVHSGFWVAFTRKRGRKGLLIEGEVDGAL